MASYFRAVPPLAGPPAPLLRCPSLRRVTLSWNPIGDRGARSLLDALHRVRPPIPPHPNLSVQVTRQSGPTGSNIG